MSLFHRPTPRRTFFQRTALIATAATATVALPRSLSAARSGTHVHPMLPIQDPKIKELIQRGLDAARQGRASYADIRLTHTRRREMSDQNINDHETMTVGVRALCDGYWGFASGPVWSADEMVRLGREAALQAATVAQGKPRRIDLAPVAVVQDGHWEMPVKTDPFSVYPVEIQDYLQGLRLAADLVPFAKWDQAQVVCVFVVQEKAFGATTGSYYTQRIYRTEGGYQTSWEKGQRRGKAGVDTLSPAGMGLELLQDQPLTDLLRQSVEEAIEDAHLPVDPIDVGRHDIVLDARGMASLVGETLGAATELDRALGYEANASGTSYLNDPVEMLNTFAVGSTLLNVTANRNDHGALATVGWDDEGVSSRAFPLIKNGVLHDFQTTREAAEWLSDAYARDGRAVQSNGCAYAPSGLHLPLAHTANLVLLPGQDTAEFDDLVRLLDRGIAFKGLMTHMDFQKSNGLGSGSAYQIRRGKRVARIEGAGLLFKTTELWKKLTGIGGATSARRFGTGSQKGEPPQTGYYSVTAVPALLKDIAVIDALRKA